MILNFHTPRYPLNQFFEPFIYYEGVTHEHSVDRFLPNGDTEILIDFNDGPQFIYDNNTLKEIQACRHVWTSGIRTEPITIPSGNGAAMMVLTFKKGMAGSFYPFPMDEISDAVVDAELVWGHGLGNLRESMLATSVIDDRFAMVETYLLRRFKNTMKIDPCVAFAIAEMSHRPDHLSIARMNAKIGYSQKHFAALFRRQVGVTPKAYLKIMRFQKAITTIGLADDIDWRQISLECGFYDQAHFINDFKHYSGFTPEQYASIHTNYQNYIPVG